MMDGRRFQEETALRKFMVTLEAQETARKSQWNFLTHLTLEIENKELTMMFSDMVRLAFNLPEMENYSLSGYNLLSIVSLSS